MIELRWNNGILEQRTRVPRTDATGAFCDFTEWTDWHPVPVVTQSQPSLPNGIEYGGRGIAGENYWKRWGNTVISIWTKGDESWTSDELRAIADHNDWLYQQKDSK